MQTPPSAPVEFSPRTDEARALVARALAGTGGLLSGPAAEAALAAYGVPVAVSAFAVPLKRRVSPPPSSAFQCASIISPDIAHKWEVGGVALRLGSAAAVTAAARRCSNR